MKTDLCKDCKYVKRAWHSFFSFEFAVCIHPLLRDRVSGKTGAYCSIERDSSFDIINPCGSEGKLFVKK